MAGGYWVNQYLARELRSSSRFRRGKKKYLRQEDRYAIAPRPQLILLDLNLPKKNGREVLAELRQDPELKSIPVVVLSTSRAPLDIRMSYRLHANCYLVKPSDIEEFNATIRSIEEFWLSRAKLPTQ